MISIAPTSAPATATPATEQDLPYFEVGVVKFVVMSIVTFGIYEVYWAAQQWTRLKARIGEDLSPFWRAIFINFWSFSLFRRIQAESNAHGVRLAWSTNGLAVGYFVLSMLWRLPDPWWYLSLLSFLPFIPMVRAISALHDTQRVIRDRNTSFGLLNMFAISCGLALLLIGLAGDGAGAAIAAQD